MQSEQTGSLPVCFLMDIHIDDTSIFPFLHTPFEIRWIGWKESNDGTVILSLRNDEQRQIGGNP
ncbi:hypothetical protein AMI01nite_42670 [Aneurinibacillus migulanus]|nr:hypothetical protein AMI01nite_42670 [Aneurinibacillus migulanus]